MIQPFNVSLQSGMKYTVLGHQQMQYHITALNYATGGFKKLSFSQIKQL